MTFFIASAVGVVGGLFFSSYAGMARFDFSIEVGLIGFSAAVVGGLGSMPGAIIGSLLIAGLDTLVHSGRERRLLPSRFRLPACHRRPGVQTLRPSRPNRYRESVITTLSVASRKANRLLSAMALVVAIEAVGAVLLRQFLLVVTLLAIFATALVAFERRPNLEDAIATAFRTQSGFTILLGVVLVALFPFALEKNTYALHLCVVAQLYAVLALALKLPVGQRQHSKLRDRRVLRHRRLCLGSPGPELRRQLLDRLPPPSPRSLASCGALRRCGRGTATSPW